MNITCSWLDPRHCGWVFPTPLTNIVLSCKTSVADSLNLTRDTEAFILQQSGAVEDWNTWYQVS